MSSRECLLGNRQDGKCLANAVTSRKRDFSCIQEHEGEDIRRIFMYCSSSSQTELCLEELVLPSIEQVPQNEVGSSSEIWQNLNVSDFYAEKGTIV